MGEFTNDFLEPLLEKLSFEKKEVIIMGDFKKMLVTIVNSFIRKKVYLVTYFTYLLQYKPS